MKKILLSLFLISIVGFMNAQNRNTAVMGEEITYKSADGTILTGYVAYDKNKKGKRPTIVVIHEWWGCNEYVRKRADMLAALGYILFL